MKNQTASRKLKLNRETLRTLDAGGLVAVKGGGMLSWAIGGSCEACSEFNACGGSNYTSCYKR